MSGPDLVERNTHLIDWLSDGHTHCKHGTKDWCESYLHNARDVIKAQDAELSALRSRCETLEREKGALIARCRVAEADAELWQIQVEKAEAARDEAVAALEEAEVVVAYAAKASRLTPAALQQLSDDARHFLDRATQPLGKG